MVIGISIGIAAVSAAVTIGFQVDGYIKGKEQMERQDKANIRNAHLTKASNYRNAVSVLQSAARGVALQDYLRHEASREDLDSVAFKRKQTPFHTANRTTRSDPSSADDRMRNTFIDARTVRGNGRPT